MTRDPKTILLAAGGTAGHVFPALALAEELTARGHSVRACTDARGARYFEGRLAANVLSSGGLASGSPIKRLKGLAQLLRGYGQARGLLQSVQPDIIVGFGGYPSAPPLLAAQRAGIPTLLHEQNSVFGKANRLTARKATAVALSFESTVAAPENAQYSGNPVRSAFEALPAFSTPAAGKIRVLGTGGSLGGAPVARALADAIALLSAEQRAQISLLAQAPEPLVAELTAHYSTLQVDATVTAFVDDMPAEMGLAQLIIARSGATTVTEIIAAQRPALFVPLDVHADRHQILNAQALVHTGAARMILQSDLSPEKLAGQLAELIDAPAQLTAMAESAKQLAALQQNRRDGRTAVQALADITLSCAK